MSNSVFDSHNRANHTEALAFLDPNGGVTTQRYETMKYRSIDKLTDKQLGFFWRPEEVDLTKDTKDFKNLSADEKKIFTDVLSRAVLLDSVQGRSPTLAFLPIVSLPEIEAWIQAWAFSEMIHSRSYTHIIRNVYSNPSEVFDVIMDNQEIVDCADDITKNYDELIDLSRWFLLLGEGHHTVNGKTVSIDLYEIKKALYKTIMSVNILEGVRFYSAFATIWAFAENKKMEGSAKILKLICRDENLHLASTQSLLKLLPKDDPDYAKIAVEEREACVKLFVDAAEQEKKWARYVFENRALIGLNANLLCEYVEWTTNKRMTAVGLPTHYKTGSNPLPWTQKWIAGSEVQMAPQQVQIAMYTIGSVNQDVTTDTFKGFSL